MHPPIRESGGSGRAQLLSERIVEERFGLLVQNATHHAIYMLDTYGIVATWNTGAERITGYATAEIIGVHFERFYTTEDRAADIPAKALQIARESGRHEADGWCLRKDGTSFWANTVIDRILDDYGALLGFSHITRDIERRRAQQALLESDRQFRLLVNGVREYAICMLDPSGIVTSWNSGAERIKGYRAEEIIGQHFSKFYAEADRAAGLPERLLRGAEASGRFETEGQRVRKDGTTFWANVVIDSIRDDNGRHIGFAKITRDISEQQKSARLKDEFIATVSHELRTPLTAINASLALLADTEDGGLSSETKELISIAHVNGQRLHLLVNDILDIEKLEAGKVTFRFQKVDIVALLNEEVEVDQVLAANRNITLRLEASGVHQAYVDPDRLKQVISNLLSNAIKFSPPGADVLVSAESDIEIVRVSVRDHGPGISQEFKCRIFEKFAQADMSDAKQRGGTGLGLSIVREIVQRLGGRVGFYDAPGGGAVFFIDLPRLVDTPLIDRQFELT
jgi:PAS domain S-box-containing protein